MIVWIWGGKGGTEQAACDMSRFDTSESSFSQSRHANITKEKQAIYIAEYYDYYAGLADKVEGTVLPIDKPNVQAITTRIPIGVVAAIIPWNSQMFLTATKLAPALAMGNTVVIKSSELAPAVLFEFA